MIFRLSNKELKTFGLSLFVGLIAHFFVISNPLFNADGIFYNKSMGAGSIIGRWLIEVFNTIAEKIGYTTVIPMLNIVIALVIIAYSSAFLIRILKFEKDIHCYIVSIIMVLSPALIQTFFYGFTAHIYALALFLTIFSIYLIIEKEQIVLYIILNCLALAIYQAYVPTMLCIYIAVFIKILKDEDFHYFIVKLLKCLGSFFVAFLMYYMMNVIVNKKYDGYIWRIHGMSESFVPNFTFESICENINKAYVAVLDIPFKHNVFAHNTTIFIRWIYFLLILMTIAWFVLFIKIYLFDKNLYEYERKLMIKKAGVIVLLFLLIPLAFNFIFVMTNGGIAYFDDRLSYSYIFYIIYPIFFIGLIYDCHIRKGLKVIKVFEKVTISLIVLIFVHNVWLSYGSYYNQYKVINASKSFAIELATNIKMLPNYSNKTKVLFIGSPFAKSEYYDYAYYADVEHNLYANFDVEYENFLSEYPMKQLFKEFTSLDFADPSEDFADNLYYSSEVKNMPLYPNNGSVKMFDDVVVVKFRNL